VGCFECNSEGQVCLVSMDAMRCSPKRRNIHRFAENSFWVMPHISQLPMAPPTLFFARWRSAISPISNSRCANWLAFARQAVELQCALYIRQGLRRDGRGHLGGKGRNTRSSTTFTNG